MRQMGPKPDFAVIELQVRRNSLHPWIFRKMIREPKRPIPPGALVRVVTREGEFVAWGMYSTTGSLAIRILSELERERPDEGFFRARLQTARAFREESLKLSVKTDAYRLIHAEADGLPGLVVDKYADVFVIEPYAPGYFGVMEGLIRSLRELYPGARAALRPDMTQAQRDGVGSLAEDLTRRYAPPDDVTIRENAIRMKINFKSGHKTGYFLDQRDNRAKIAGLAAGRRVLDLFCYTGGFSISAAKGGAAEVAGVDLDEKALKIAEENVRLNGVRIGFTQRNVFDHLRDMVKEGRRTDMVILDPSKLAGVRDEIPRAKRTYGDLNRLAMKVTEPGGILLTCSCSGLISEPEFLSILTQAAAEAAVVLQIFRIGGASPDHPVSSIYPESRYLKTVFARVMPGNEKRIVSEEEINPKPKSS